MKFLTLFFTICTAWAVVSTCAPAAELSEAGANNLNIVYGKASGNKLLLDAHVPEGKGPFPVLLIVHGGGWSNGDKETDIVPEMATALTNFTWFTINYRLAPTNRWPAGYDDVLIAIRWVKKHAPAYKGDPKQIGIIGYSAGGHLVTLAGTRTRRDTRVQAVVGLAPPTEIAKDAVRRGSLDKWVSMENLLGSKVLDSATLKTMNEISPVNHVRSGLPPFLLVQGDLDTTVPCVQTLDFESVLKRNGVPCDFIVIQGGKHRIKDWARLHPGWATEVADWLQQHLQKNANSLPSQPSDSMQALGGPQLPVIPAGTFNIMNYGARGDGLTTNTAAIQSSIDAARTAGGGTVEIPPGNFLCGPIHLMSDINLHLDGGATLLMLPIDKYPGGTVNPESFISGSNLHDVVLSGSGMINGQGIPWWPYARQRGARRPIMIHLLSCDRVLIKNVTLSNSPMFHIAISGRTTNVTVRGVTIRANPSSDPVNPGHNTDACDVSGRNILIEDCNVSVGDDDFTCGGNTSDVLITNCTYGYGHGVSIGSGTYGGVSNFTVINCTFNNTEQGIRIKSDRDRGGYVHNLKYINLSMTNVVCPILIYASYMATNREFRNLNDLSPAVAATYSRRPPEERTPIYENILFSNITATVQAGGRAGLIWGLPEMPATNIVLQQVCITAGKPFGIYEARDVKLISSKIIVPKGTPSWVSTNAEIETN